jgi:hypothetical protein
VVVAGLRETSNHVSKGVDGLIQVNSFLDSHTFAVL